MENTKRITFNPPLPPERSFETSPFYGGFFSDGSHAWFICKNELHLAHLPDCQKSSVWVFEEQSTKLKVCCVTDYLITEQDTSQTLQCMIVGLETPYGGELHIIDLNSSKTIRIIELPFFPTHLTPIEFTEDSVCFKEI